MCSMQYACVRVCVHLCMLCVCMCVCMCVHLCVCMLCALCYVQSHRSGYLAFCTTPNLIFIHIIPHPPPSLPPLSLTYSCYISHTGVFFGAFIGPIFAIVLLNCVIFVIVTAVLIRRTMQES